MSQQSWDRVTIDAQSVDAPLSAAAIFLVVTIRPGDGPLATVRDVLDGVNDLV